jgi:hypothetical protein
MKNHPVINTLVMFTPLPIPKVDVTASSIGSGVIKKELFSLQKKSREPPNVKHCSKQALNIDDVPLCKSRLY